MKYGINHVKNALGGYDSGDEEYKNIVAKIRPVVSKNPLGRGLGVGYAHISNLYTMPRVRMGIAPRKTSLVGPVATCQIFFE